MSKSKVRATALLLLTFAAGVAAGVAADRTWLDDRPAAAADAPEAAAGSGEARDAKRHPNGADGRDEKKRDRPHTVIERFADELGLTAEQRSRIETILSHHRESMKEMWSEVRPRFRTLVDSARSQIEEVLTAEQVEQYRDLLRRERGRDDHPDDSLEGPR